MQQEDELIFAIDSYPEKIKEQHEEDTEGDENDEIIELTVRDMNF